MKRYLRVYKEFLTNDLIKNLHFKENFFFNLGEGLFLFFINLIFYNAIFQQTNNIAGWSKNEMMLLVATYQIFIGIFYGLFANNLPGLSYYVNKGDLDFILVKPISAQFYISTRYVSIGHLLSSFAAIPLLIQSIHRLNLNFGFIEIIAYIISILISLIIAYSIMLMFMSLSIWLIKVSGIYIIIMQIFSYATYPKNIFNKIFKTIFTFIIPIIVVCNYPVDVLLKGINIKYVIYEIIICCCFFFISKMFFSYALSKYSSASS